MNIPCYIWQQPSLDKAVPVRALLAIASLKDVLAASDVRLAKDEAKGDLPPNKLGSFACRVLLSFIQQTLIKSTTCHCSSLNQSQHPYHFDITLSQDSLTTNRRYFVSFSHSHQHVALLLAQTPAIGIDIEDKPVSLGLARRYFSPNELSWLCQLPLSQQPQAAKLLWLLKEAKIKQQGNQQQHTTLFTGLRHDISQQLELSQLTAWLKPNQQSKLIAETTNFQLIAVQPVTCRPLNRTANDSQYFYLPEPPCAFIIGNAIDS